MLPKGRTTRRTTQTSRNGVQRPGTRPACTRFTAKHMLQHFSHCEYLCYLWFRPCHKADLDKINALKGLLAVYWTADNAMLRLLMFLLHSRLDLFLLFFVHRYERSLREPSGRMHGMVSQFQTTTSGAGVSMEWLLIEFCFPMFTTVSTVPALSP